MLDVFLNIMQSILTQYLAELGLSDEQAMIVCSIFNEELVAEKGDYFLKAGQTCNIIGFITSGMCRYYYDTDKEEITRFVSFENEFITSLSFIMGIPTLENIQFIKSSNLLIASKEDWQRLYKEHEFVRNFWTKIIESNYIGMENRVFNLIALNAEERYDWMLKNQPKFNQFVPDKYVASILGIQPRHLSRIRANTK
jgi:CRP/FNR family transcriptional regulator, anaerobic regulatory protein